MFFKLILERGGEEAEREINTDVREKHHQLPLFAPRQGMEPTTFWRTGRRSKQLSSLARAVFLCLKAGWAYCQEARDFDPQPSDKAQRT